MKFEDALDFPEKDEVLFDSKNVCAVFSPADARTHETLVVTFYPFFPPEAKKQPLTGFSRESFRKLGYDTIHVLPAGNHWYQYADIEEMLKVISLRRKEYKRLVLFGQSMGAYGALHCSKGLEADRVVAICAQYTTDINKVDFDPGWQHYIKLEGVKFIRDNFEDNVNVNSELILAYDPLFLQDKRHAVEIRKRMNAIGFIMPFCEHSIGKHLAVAGLMPLSLGILVSGDQAEIQRLRQTFRKARRSSNYFNESMFLTMVRRLKEQKRYDDATKMVRKRLQTSRSLVVAKAYYEISEAQQDNEETARRLLEIIGRLGDETSLEIYKRCLYRLRISKDFHTAETLAARVLKTYPNDVSVLREYAESTHLQHKWEESKSRWIHYRSILKDRTPALAYLRLAHAEENLGKSEEALALIEEGLKIYNDDPGLNAWQLKHKRLATN